MAKLNPVNQYDHALGPTSAPIVLVEYGDFECPYSGEAYFSVKDILARYDPIVLFAFRHFPLSDIHPHAEAASEAAEAAGAQGLFWEMHDTIFEHQDELDHSSLMNYAESIGLDLTLFSLALDEGAFTARVARDLVSGEESGVQGTPTFFINGILHEGGYDFASMTEAIDRELDKGRGNKSKRRTLSM